MVTRSGLGSDAGRAGSWSVKNALSQSVSKEVRKLVGQLVSELIRTSIYDKYSGSVKVTTHLYHMSDKT